MKCKRVKKEFSMVVSGRSEVQRTISNERTETTVCLPFANPNNYLKYGDGENDFLLVGNGITFLIYK